MEDLIKLLQNYERRIETLERVAKTGRLIPELSADPTGTDIQIYYNTSTNKYKVNENGTWRTITTS